MDWQFDFIAFSIRFLFVNSKCVGSFIKQKSIFLPDIRKLLHSATQISDWQVEFDSGGR